MDEKEQSVNEFVEEMTRRRIAENNERNKEFRPGAERKARGLTGLLMKTYLFDTEHDARVGFTVFTVVVSVVALIVLVRFFV